VPKSPFNTIAAMPTSQEYNASAFAAAVVAHAAAEQPAVEATKNVEKKAAGPAAAAVEVSLTRGLSFFV